MQPEEIANLRLKHLEFIQAVVCRMSLMSGQLKKLCITLFVAALSAAITLQQASMTLISVFVILIFWILDIQYLRTERRYRLLYDDVRNEGWGRIPSFSMKPEQEVSFFSVFKSWSTLGFYGPIFLVLLGVSFLVGGFKCLVAFIRMVLALALGF